MYTYFFLTSKACVSYLCMDNFNSSRRGNIVVNWIACKMFPHLFTGAPSFHSWKLFLKNSERFFNLYFADTIYFKNLHVYANRVKNNQGNQVFLYHEHLETAEITISHRTGLQVLLRSHTSESWRNESLNCNEKRCL